jgi:hypothetical protein
MSKTTIMAGLMFRPNKQQRRLEAWLVEVDDQGRPSTNPHDEELLGTLHGKLAMEFPDLCQRWEDLMRDCVVASIASMTKAEITKVEVTRTRQGPSGEEN